MKKDSVNQIEKCVASKVKHFGYFSKLTDKICESDFEGLAELIAKRQVEITVIDGLTDEISSIVKNMPKDQQNKINKVLSYEYSEDDSTLSSLINQVKELEKILMAVTQKEVFAKQRMDLLKDELENQMEQLTKSKQTIDYVNSFATINNNGTTFDSLT